MPSFQDSAVIFFIALLLFGPKKLPELARYVGKLMNEFRRASTEFRMQMDDEFRQSEQAEQQKKIAAMEAAAPTRACRSRPASPSRNIRIRRRMRLRRTHPRPSTARPARSVRSRWPSQKRPDRFRLPRTATCT